MALTIYGTVASRAVRPLWVARELELDVVHVPTPFADGATRTPEFLALNPNGHIPLLIDQRAEGQVVVWESMACALYLARHHGRGDGSDVAPAHAREDAEALRWAFWAVTEIEKDALTVLQHRMTLPEPKRQLALAEQAEQRLLGPLRVLEQHLQAQQARGQAYVAAARFTVADVCLASVVNWVRPARALWAEVPLTLDWVLRCVQRPAHEALRQAGRASASSKA